MIKKVAIEVPLAIAFALLCTTSSIAQAPQKPQEEWWTGKTKGGVWPAPMRPLWKLSDLKKMHAGQATWQETIVKDQLQEATYHSAAPSTKVIPRMHVDAGHAFVVTGGQLKFTVEGQDPVTATRGSVIHIAKTTLYSYEVVGTENALWVEIGPAFYKTLYPASGPAPVLPKGEQLTKVMFDHKPGPYIGENKLHYNTFELLASCKFPDRMVLDDHLALNMRPSYVNPADDPCRKPGAREAAPNENAIKDAALYAQPASTFNFHSTFGHMHPEYAEWWIVQAGLIKGRFENAGEFEGEEGDVLYAPPSTWHAMAAAAPSGPSIRLVIAAYNPVYNMFNTTGK